MNKFFEATTICTDEEWNRFFKFSVRRKNATPLVLFVIGIIWAAFILYFDLTLIASGEVAGMVANSIVNLPVLFLFGNEYLFLPSSSVKKYKKGNYFVNINIDTVTFYQDYIEIVNQHSVTRISYYEVFRVYETKTNFYIFVTNTEVGLINKMNFQIGTPQDLHNFLAFSLREKFILI